MNMSPPREDFHALRRLLALKRHETPSPGYFNDFSGQVIARIRHGERGEEGSFGAALWEAPWLQRLWAALEAKPILAGGFAAAACAVLVLGVVYSEGVPMRSADSVAMQAPGVPGSDSMLLREDRPLINPVAVAAVPVSSTGGAIAQLPGESPLPGGSLFEQLRPLQEQRVVYPAAPGAITP